MKQSLARRIGRIALRIALGLVTLVLTLLVLLTFALGLAPVRELVRKQANLELEKALMGKVTLERIGHLDYRGVRGVDASAYDPKGQRVIVLRGLDVETFWPRIVWSALTDEGFVNIQVDVIRIGHVDVRVRDDGKGGPTLASVFEPKPKPSTPGPPTEVRLRIGRIQAGNFWVHGRLSDAPTIDGDARDFDAALASDAKGTTLRVDRVRLAVRALPEKIDPNGTLSGRLELPSAGGPRGQGRFAGTVAGAKLHAEGSWDGTSLHALVSSPDISGRAAEPLGLDVRDPTSLRVAVDGKWPDVRLDGTVAGRAVHLAIRGQGRIAKEVQAAVTLDAKNVDLSGLVRDGPSSELSLHAEVELVKKPSGELEGEYRFEAPAGRVEAVATPPIETHGRLSGSPEGELSVVGQVTVSETGAPIEAAYRVRAKTGTVLAHADLSAKFENPPRFRALGVRASGTLAASLDFDSGRKLLDAHAKMFLPSVQHASVRAHRVALAARVMGSVTDPNVEADLRAGPVDMSGRRFHEVRVTAAGKQSRFLVKASTTGTSPKRIQAETAVLLTDAVELEGLRVALFGDEEEPVELRASRIQVSEGRVKVEGLGLRGAGQAHGDLDLLTNRQRVRFSASDLELGKLTRLFGVRVPFRRALVSADIAVERRATSLQGHIRARASEVRIGKLDDASASVDLTLTPKDISGTADADFGEGGRFHVELEHFQVPREPWTLERLARQPGSLVARGDLRLAGFLPLLEAADLPVARIAGRAKFEITAKGGNSPNGPAFEGRIETQGLRLVERRAQKTPVESAEEARRVEPRALEDIDVRALLEFVPEKRLARADVELRDKKGTIVTLKGETELAENWPRTLSKSWRTQPLRARLEVPRRSLDTFPVAVRPSTVKGFASARLDLEGSVADPTVDAEVVLEKLRVRSRDEPVRVALTTHYERSKGALSVAAERRSHTVASLEAQWRGDAVRLATIGANERSPIVLDAEGKLEDFPLTVIPALLDRQIGGSLSGKLRVDGLGRDAKLDVSLDGSKMSIGQVRMQHLDAKVEVDAGRVRANVLAGDKSGSAELAVQTRVVWGDRLVPSIPKEAEGRLMAKSFRLETLNPLTKDAVNELAGRLDADLRVALAPGKTELSGEASVREGVVQVPAVGQRFTGVTGRVRIENDRVLVRDVSARGPTGRVTARAAARLDGLELVTAEAHVAIAKNEKLPVTLQGAALGDAWGRAAVLYRRTDGATEIRVDVPSLHVELAEDGDLEVQSLDDVESIRMGTRLADGTFTTLPVQPLEPASQEEEPSSMRVRVMLGKNVEIERGPMLKVKLGGEVVMTSNGETRMTGRLELRGGKLDVQGKIFEIERGLVTFGGDPSNPTITATARWDSPLGYSVYAEYSGDVRNGKITLRSEPPLNQDEVASLLMFGDPEGSVATGAGDTSSAATAVGVAGDTAARGINRAISDFTNLDVAARVDTSTGVARPELVVQISPRVAARVTRAVGEPQAGQPPDRTFLTVEFRFTRSWSVSGVVGDHGGSGMDVIWRRRY